MDHGAFQALVAVLQADHALHVRGRGLVRGQAERDWSLNELLAALGGEVAHNLPLRVKETMVSTGIKAPINTFLIHLSSSLISASRGQ